MVSNLGRARSSFCWQKDYQYQWPFQEPIHWRYLSYIRPIYTFQRISPQNTAKQYVLMHQPILGSWRSSIDHAGRLSLQSRCLCMHRRYRQLLFRVCLLNLLIQTRSAEHSNLSVRTVSNITGGGFSPTPLNTSRPSSVFWQFPRLTHPAWLETGATHLGNWWSNSEHVQWVNLRENLNRKP